MNENFYQILHHYCFGSSRTGRVMFSTVLNSTSALDQLAGRQQGSQLCHCSKIRWEEAWEKLNCPQENPFVVNELQDLKNQLHRLTEIKFPTKQKTKRAVPVSKSRYSTYCKFSSTTNRRQRWSLLYLSHCTSFSSTIKQASALKGQGYQRAYINPPLSCKAGTKGEESHIILFYVFPNMSTSNARKIYR